MKLSYLEKVEGHICQDELREALKLLKLHAHSEKRVVIALFSWLSRLENSIIRGVITDELNFRERQKIAVAIILLCCQLEGRED